MASAVAPIISTPYFSSTPILRSDSAVLSAVCPPMVGSSASGRSLAMILRDDLRRDRLDIGRVGQVRVGHDGRRIGIDQNDPVALFLERLAGLGAGIVELAGLADDDRSGADDQDRGDVGPFGHWLFGSRRRSASQALAREAESIVTAGGYEFRARPSAVPNDGTKKGRACRASPAGAEVPPPRAAVFRPETAGREGGPLPP